MRSSRFPAKAAQAARHVGLEGNPRLLTVIAYVYAGLHLCRNDLAGRTLHLACKRSPIDHLTSFLSDQQVGKGFVARQAAHVGRQDPISALEHCGDRVLARLREACPTLHALPTAIARPLTPVI